MPKLFLRIVAVLLMPSVVLAVIGLGVRAVINDSSLPARDDSSHFMTEALMPRLESSVTLLGHAAGTPSDVIDVTHRIPNIGRLDFTPGQAWAEEFVRHYDRAYAHWLGKLAGLKRHEVEEWLAKELEIEEDWVYLAEVVWGTFSDDINWRRAVSKGMNWLSSQMRSWPWLGKGEAIHFEEFTPGKQIPVRDHLIPIGRRKRWVLHAHLGFKDRSGKLNEFNGLQIFLEKRGNRFVSSKVAVEMKMILTFFDLDNVPLTPRNRLWLKEQIQDFLDLYREDIAAAMHAPLPLEPLVLCRGRIDNILTDMYEIAEKGYGHTPGGGIEFLKPVTSWKEAMRPARKKPMNFRSGNRSRSRTVAAA